MEITNETWLSSKISYHLQVNYKKAVILNIKSTWAHSQYGLGLSKAISLPLTISIVLAVKLHLP